MSKFADHLPLYRLERIFKRESIDLTPQTMSQWVIKVSDAIIPLVNLLQDNVLDYDVSFADETTFQVLKEPGRGAQTKSYIWCFVGGPVGRRSVLYQCHPARKAEAAEQVFEGYSRAIHSDGCSGCHQLIPRQCRTHSQYSANIKTPPKGGVLMLGGGGGNLRCTWLSCQACYPALRLPGYGHSPDSSSARVVSSSSRVSAGRIHSIQQI